MPRIAAAFLFQAEFELYQLAEAELRSVKTVPNCLATTYNLFNSPD